ncbi:MAG: DnaJ domain-containing protein [Proteobacteria bacterium]|nr:DnaJ domain-containing protein [Pseudomonadota bacterium]MBU1612434.1 DnaJ domain-containing protein [Pseudomonadota bacterium]
MNLQDCYRILGAPPNSDLEQVKSAFRKQAFKLHPDLNPSSDAQAQFQHLNEAYVILKAALEADPPPRPGRAAPKPEKPKASAQDGAKAYTKQEQAARSFAGGPTRKETRTQGPTRKAFFFKKEEVLKDILNDPFARQVFEDIYQHIKRDRPGYTPPKQPVQRSLQVSLGRQIFNIDLSRGPLTRIKQWCKGQLDDEQTIAFPVHQLIPGRTIRLEIGSRFGKSKTVEMRIPADFSIGKPIRLKGLGRCLGPFKGDLFLRIIGK